MGNVCKYNKENNKIKASQPRENHDKAKQGKARQNFVTLGSKI